MIVNIVERIRPCTCGHLGARHWHKWTEYPNAIYTVGDFQCHFFWGFGCSCLGYKDMENLKYLQWLDINKKWPRKWFTWLL